MAAEQRLNQDEAEGVEATFTAGCADFTESKLAEVLCDEEIAHEKAEKHLGKHLADFKLLWQLLKDYHTGSYTEIPWRFIAVAGFAMLYLINPFDVIPDILPAVGYLDDISVFGLVATGCKNEIAHYKTLINNKKT